MQGVISLPRFVCKYTNYFLNIQTLGAKSYFLPAGAVGFEPTTYGLVTPSGLAPESPEVTCSSSIV